MDSIRPLRIRAVQLDALQAEGFRDRLEQHVRAACPESTGHLTLEEMDRRMGHALAVADFYGFEGTDGVKASLVTLLFQTGPLFHWHPALHAILARREQAPEVRMRRLFAESSAWSWVAVTDPSDGSWRRAIEQWRLR
jgi:hypothetical protein